MHLKHWFGYFYHLSRGPDPSRRPPQVPRKLVRICSSAQKVARVLLSPPNDPNSDKATALQVRPPYFCSPTYRSPYSMEYGNWLAQLPASSVYRLPTKVSTGPAPTSRSLGSSHGSYALSSCGRLDVRAWSMETPAVGFPTAGAFGKRVLVHETRWCWLLDTVR